MQIRSLVQALASPLSWCFAAYMLSMQMSLFGMTSLLGTHRIYAADSPMFYHLVGFVLCAAILVLSKARALSLSRSTLVTVLGAIAGVFGVILLAATDQMGSRDLFSVVGCALVASSSVLMGIQLQELFGSIGSQLKSVLVVGALVEAILLLAYPLLYKHGYVVAALLFAVRAVLYWLSSRSGDGEAVRTEVARATPSEIFFPKTLVAGIAVLVVSWSFLQTAIYMRDDWLVTILLVATKLIALVAFTYFMFSAHDLNFAPAGKLMCIFVLCAMALNLGRVNAYMSSGIMDIGYSLFELVLYVALADVISHRPERAVEIISVVYAVVHGAYLLGGALSLACNAQVLDGALVETLLLMALVVAALCCFDEKRIAGFFLSITGEGADNQLEASIDDPLMEALSSFDLTSREKEIALLYARGRSAVYIAEDLQISPHTVRSHVSRIYEKCAVHSRQELMSLVESACGGNETYTI